MVAPRLARSRWCGRFQRAEARGSFESMDTGGQIATSPDKSSIGVTAARSKMQLRIRQVSPPVESLLAPALQGDPSAVQAMVAALTPIIQARAARALVRKGGPWQRDLRQELGDLTQDVLLLLFREDARILRAWEPSRGLSLLNYVGLVAEREVGHIAQSGKRNPWALDPTEASELEDTACSTAGPESDVGSRQLFDRLHARLAEELNPRAMELYRLLVVEDAPIAKVSERLGLSADAVYAWRSRLLKRARQLLVELQTPSSSEFAPTPATPGGSYR
jgi:DNA-directed RNA polymerase specialized sigma24 family protein